MASLRWVLEQAREWRYTPLLSYLVLVFTLVFLFSYTIRGLCQTSIQTRATFIVFGEILILESNETAARADEPPWPEREERIDVFRNRLDTTYVQEMSATCRGLMTLDEYQDAVHREVARALVPMNDVESQ